MPTLTAGQSQFILLRQVHAIALAIPWHSQKCNLTIVTMCSGKYAWYSCDACGQDREPWEQESHRGAQMDTFVLGLFYMIKSCWIFASSHLFLPKMSEFKVLFYSNISRLSSLKHGQTNLRKGNTETPLPTSILKMLLMDCFVVIEHTAIEIVSYQCNQLLIM